MNDSRSLFLLPECGQHGIQHYRKYLNHLVKSWQHHLLGVLIIGHNKVISTHAIFYVVASFNMNLRVNFV